VPSVGLNITTYTPCILQQYLGGYCYCRDKSHRVVDRGYGRQDLYFRNRRRYDEGEEEMVSFTVPFQSEGSMNWKP
jgi:hypothetical protein